MLLVNLTSTLFWVLPVRFARVQPTLHSNKNKVEKTKKMKNGKSTKINFFLA